MSFAPAVGIDNLEYAVRAPEFNDALACSQSLDHFLTEASAATVTEQNSDALDKLIEAQLKATNIRAQLKATVAKHDARTANDDTLQKSIDGCAGDFDMRSAVGTAFYKHCKPGTDVQNNYKACKWGGREASLSRTVV